MGHRPNQPQGQLPGRTGVVSNEVLDMIRNAVAFDVTAGLNFLGDFVRDILRPMLKCVKCDNADRGVELSHHEIGDDSFEVCPFDFGFSVDTSQQTEAVDYQIDGLIRAVGHDRWHPTRPRHSRTPRNRTGKSIKSATTCSERHWSASNAGYCVPARRQSAKPSGWASASRFKGRSDVVSFV